MADFKTAVKITMDSEHEGGFQIDFHDSGNWTSGVVGQGELKGTKYGISAHQYPDMDIENLSVEDAEAIYQKDYWGRHYNEIQDQNFCNKLFDYGVMASPAEAVKLLQNTLNLNPDGAFGPETLQIVNQSEPVSLLNSYKTALVSHSIGIAVADPNKRPNLSDWIRRINS